MKHCFKCHEKKALKEFYKHSKMADGHLGKCILCARKDTAQTKKRNPEKYRELNRLWAVSLRGRERYRRYAKTEEAKEIIRRSGELWRKQNPEKRKAHDLVASAIRSGKMKRKPCLKCGKKGQAHHDDYSKPLKVRWLCPTHHGEHHRFETLARKS